MFIQPAMTPREDASAWRAAAQRMEAVFNEKVEKDRGVRGVTLPGFREREEEGRLGGEYKTRAVPCSGGRSRRSVLVKAQSLQISNWGVGTQSA